MTCFATRGKSHVRISAHIGVAIIGVEARATRLLGCHGHADPVARVSEELHQGAGAAALVPSQPRIRIAGQSYATGAGHDLSLPHSPVELCALNVPDTAQPLLHGLADPAYSLPLAPVFPKRGPRGGKSAHRKRQNRACSEPARS